VNLTDGFDGLRQAQRPSCASFLAWSASCSTGTRASTAVHSAAEPRPGCDGRWGGACVGFLWVERRAGPVNMGDTGSLAIGTGLACLALSMNVQLLLPIHRRPVRHRDDVGGDQVISFQGL